MDFINKAHKFFWYLSSLRFKIFFKKFGNFSFIKKPIYLGYKNYICIGKRVKIMHNARIEAIPVYAKQKFKPNLIIEDDVSIQQNFHCTCANKVIIKKGVSITQNVGIFDINHEYYKIDENISKQEISVKEVIIGENSFIGMNSVILPGTRLGKQNIVAAGSIVNGCFPDYCVIAGQPARIIKKFDVNTKKWLKINEEGDFINE